MALHLRGKVWWADFQSNRKHVQVSTKTHDRAEAEKIQEMLRGKKLKTDHRDELDPGLYFLQSPALQLVKIGCSGNAARRIEDLRNMNADDLVLLAKIKTKQYRTAESVIHDFFTDKHVRREWYKITADDVDFAVRYWDRIKNAENIRSRHELLPVDRERYYTLEEIADFLSLSVSFVRKTIRKGELLKVKLGNAVRVSGTDFQDYVDRCRCVKIEGTTSDLAAGSTQGAENTNA